MLTFHFVCLTWIFFRCDSIAAGLELLSGHRARHNGVGEHSLAGARDSRRWLMLAQWLPENWYQRGETWFARWPATAQAAALAGVALLIAWTSHTAVTQFIYFKF